MYQHQRLTEMMLKVKAESMRCCSVTTCPGLQNACWHTGTKHRHRLLLLELTCRFLGCNLALKHASKLCLREGRPGFPSALPHSQTSGYLVPCVEHLEQVGKFGPSAVPRAAFWPRSCFLPQGQTLGPCCHPAPWGTHGGELQRSIPPKPGFIIAPCESVCAEKQ